MVHSNGALFFCRPPTSGHRAKDLLGRVIVQGDNKELLSTPLQGYVFPPLPPNGPDLAKLLPTLHPVPVEGKNIEFIKTLAAEDEVNLILDSLLNIFFKNTRSRTEVANAVSFSRMTMEEQPQKIKSLLQKNEYNKLIIDHFSRFPDKALGVVVDVITAGNLTQDKGHSQSSEGGATLKADLNAVAPGQNVKLGEKTKRENEEHFHGEFTSEVIIACGYLPLTFRKRSLVSRIISFFQTSTMKPSIDDILVSSKMLLTMRTKRIHDPHRSLVFFGDDEEPDEGGEDKDQVGEGKQQIRANGEDKMNEATGKVAK